MNKTVKALFCMGCILIALCTICQHFNGFAPAADYVHYEQQLNGLNDWFAIFAVIAFFTGFLPAYIYESIKEMKPATAPQMEQKSQRNSTSETAPANTHSTPAEAAPALYIGQVFTAPAANCYVRVKALKPAF